jgi:hypothetical protein
LVPGFLKRGVHVWLSSAWSRRRRKLVAVADEILQDGMELLEYACVGPASVSNSVQITEFERKATGTRRTNDRRSLICKNEFRLGTRGSLMNTLLYISLQFFLSPSASLPYDREESLRSGNAHYFIFRPIPSISCYPSCHPCPWLSARRSLQL